MKCPPFERASFPSERNAAAAAKQSLNYGMSVMNERIHEWIDEWLKESVCIRDAGEWLRHGVKEYHKNGI